MISAWSPGAVTVRSCDPASEALRASGNDAPTGWSRSRSEIRDPSVLLGIPLRRTFAPCAHLRNRRTELAPTRNRRRGIHRRSDSVPDLLAAAPPRSSRRTQVMQGIRGSLHCFTDPNRSWRAVERPDSATHNAGSISSCNHEPIHTDSEFLAFSAFGDTRDVPRDGLSIDTFFLASGCHRGLHEVPRGMPAEPFMLFLKEWS
jgi:hypothetical protein